MKILNANQVQQKINRLAIQILENNSREETIILAGINRNGMAFAKLIYEAMKRIEIIQPNIILTNIQLNPAKPLDEPCVVKLPASELKDRVIVVIDDVANTGRTLQFAMTPLLEVIPKKIEIAVLVNRKHKSFPVSTKYVGLELATTLKNNIVVSINDLPKEEYAAFLE